ncbi:MAG: hypothetical protein CR967_04375 [Proteobacteria bacterium]|nr:MAG: hypothetical protein CR967_04375 [Pseudomonadota bacterium]
MKNNKSFYISILEMIALVTSFLVLVYKGPNILDFIKTGKQLPVVPIYIFIFVSLAYIIITPLYFHKETFEKRGLCISKIKNGWKEYLFSFMFGLTILSSMIYYKSLHEEIVVDYYGVFLKFSVYLVSAFAQAVIFFSFIFFRIKNIVNCSNKFKNYYSKKIITITILSILFAVFHYPNWTLAFLCFCFAMVIGWVYYSKPNIFLITIIHATLGTLLHRVYQLHMKILFTYGHQEPHYSFFRKLTPWIEQLIDNRW